MSYRPKTFPRLEKRCKHFGIGYCRPNGQQVLITNGAVHKTFTKHNNSDLIAAVNQYLNEVEKERADANRRRSLNKYMDNLTNRLVKLKVQMLQRGAVPYGKNGDMGYALLLCKPGNGTVKFEGSVKMAFVEAHRWLDRLDITLEQRCTRLGVTYKADPGHRKLVLTIDGFGSEFTGSWKSIKERANCWLDGVLALKTSIGRKAAAAEKIMVPERQLAKEAEVFADPENLMPTLAGPDQYHVGAESEIDAKLKAAGDDLEGIDYYDRANEALRIAGHAYGMVHTLPYTESIQLLAEAIMALASNDLASPRPNKRTVAEKNYIFRKLYEKP